MKKNALILVKTQRVLDYEKIVCDLKIYFWCVIKQSMGFIYRDKFEQKAAKNTFGQVWNQSLLENMNTPFC